MKSARICIALAVILAPCSFSGQATSRRRLAHGRFRVCPEGLGHEIHKEQPQIVINAIREVVGAVRSGSWQPAR
jgi:hypothetical protein